MSWACAVGSDGASRALLPRCNDRTGDICSKPLPDRRRKARGPGHRHPAADAHPDPTRDGSKQQAQCDRSNSGGATTQAGRRTTHPDHDTDASSSLVELRDHRGQRSPKLDRTRDLILVLDRTRDQQQGIEQHADLCGTAADALNPAPARQVRSLAVTQEIECALQYAQWRSQLVTGVGREQHLTLDRCLHAPVIADEGIGQRADFVATVVFGNAPQLGGRVGAVDLVRQPQHRREHACRRASARATRRAGCRAGSSPAVLRQTFARERANSASPPPSSRARSPIRGYRRSDRRRRHRVRARPEEAIGSATGEVGG